jgi:hypothetical protein
VPKRYAHGVGHGLLKGAAIGLLAQPGPWLVWWAEAPHHQSLRLQWHESLSVFVVITLVVATREVIKARKRGWAQPGAQ